MTALDILRRARERQIAEQEGAEAPPPIEPPKARQRRRKRSRRGRLYAPPKCNKHPYPGPRRARKATAAMSNRTRVYWSRECRDCPIMRECHAPLAPLTRERLDAHNRRIEETACEHLHPKGIL